VRLSSAAMRLRLTPYGTGQGHIEHDWRGVLAVKDRYTGAAALCAKRVRRSTGLMAALVQAAWLFFAAQNGGRYLRPHRPQGPAVRFLVIAADGPSRTIHCVRLPSTAGNWQSRWSTRDYLLRYDADDADGLAPPYSGTLVIRRRQCRPWPRSQPSFDKLLHLYFSFRLSDPPGVCASLEPAPFLPLHRPIAFRCFDLRIFGYRLCGRHVNYRKRRAFKIGAGTASASLSRLLIASILATQSWAISSRYLQAMVAVGSGYSRRDSTPTLMSNK